MNILHTEYSLGWGGQEMRIFTEALGMQEKGHSLFFAVQRGAELGRRAKAAGFEVLECDFRRRKVLLTVPRLVSFIKKNKIKLVNTHSSKDAWIGGIAARIAGVKIIRTRHLTGHIRGGLNSILLYKALADYVITTSSNILPIIAEKAGIPPERISCIATGINAERVKATQEEAIAFRKRHGIKESDFLVGTLCVVRSWKGIGDFIEAARILKDDTNLKFVVVGGGHLDQFLPRVEKEGLNNIIFTGHLEDPFAALKAFDIFCLLSTANEGISQASLQAAYFQKPLITTRIGGLPEVCIDQYTGYLVDTFNPEQVAEKIIALKTKPELVKQMGEQGLHLVLNKFTLKHMLDQTEEIYNKIWHDL